MNLMEGKVMQEGSDARGQEVVKKTTQAIAERSGASLKSAFIEFKDVWKIVGFECAHANSYVLYSLKEVFSSLGLHTDSACMPDSIDFSAIGTTFSTATEES